MLYLFLRRLLQSVNGYSKRVYLRFIIVHKVVRNHFIVSRIRSLVRSPQHPESGSPVHVVQISPVNQIGREINILLECSEFRRQQFVQDRWLFQSIDKVMLISVIRDMRMADLFESFIVQARLHPAYSDTPEIDTVLKLKNSVIRLPVVD